MWFVCLKVSLVDPSVLPALARLLGDASAPVTHGGVLDDGVLPDSPLGFDDPVYLALPGPLYSDPVWIVEANSATGLQVVDAKERAGLALLSRTQTGEVQDVWRCIEELGKPAFEVVVGCHVVEHRAVGHQWRQVASPTKRLGAGELEVGLVELDSPLFDGQYGDLP